jgi:hypothetical protein
VRWGRIAVAVVAVAVAVVAVLLAHDLRAWHDAMRNGDAAFAHQQGSAAWSASTILPGDPALRILGISSQLQLRRATQSAVQVIAAGNGYDNGYSESQTRGTLETSLSDLADGPNRQRNSEAENLVGILTFADSRQRGPSAPAPVERSVSAFQSAVQLDSGNEAAKYNLELLLHNLLAKGVRPGSSSSPGGPSKGHKGAGGGLPGRGY